MPTSAETGVVQKSDAVLPLARRGTTVAGADVKNYICAYYRDTAVLGRRATVLRLLGSGTAVGHRGTTALEERYYRGWRGCKKLHPPLLPQRSGTWLRYYRTGVRYYCGGRGCKKLHLPLLPYRSGTRPGSRGTTAQEERYYRDPQRYYRWYLRYYRWYLRYYRKYSSSHQVPAQPR